MRRKKKPEITNPVFTDAQISSSNILSVIIFSFKDFLDWWYVQMPIVYMLYLKRISTVVNDRLSITTLLKTFHIPWHRDYKLVGYFVGITARLLYLPIAILIYLTAVIAVILLLVFWIVVPMLSIILLILTPLIK
jgi:hypothetical protein